MNLGAVGLPRSEKDTYVAQATAAGLSASAWYRASMLWALERKISETEMNCMLGHLIRSARGVERTDLSSTRVPKVLVETIDRHAESLSLTRTEWVRMALRVASENEKTMLAWHHKVAP